MIPDRNAIDVRVQVSVANDQLLLPISEAFAHYTLLEMLDIFSLYVVVEQMSFPPTAVT
jgi:antitoxin component of MazEF toxin-antitoxin module